MIISWLGHIDVDSVRVMAQFALRKREVTDMPARRPEQQCPTSFLYRQAVFPLPLVFDGGSRGFHICRLFKFSHSVDVQLSCRTELSTLTPPAGFLPFYVRWTVSESHMICLKVWHKKISEPVGVQSNSTIPL